MNPYLDQQPAVLQTNLFDAWKSRVGSMKKVRKQNERQELVNRIGSDLGIDKKYWRGIYFTQLTNAELKEEWEKARQWKVAPAKLFNKRIRAINRAIKEKMR